MSGSRAVILPLIRGLLGKTQALAAAKLSASTTLSRLLVGHVAAVGFAFYGVKQRRGHTQGDGLGAGL
jgi:hypothetical protein